MRYFLELSYNGTAYHGWQKQPNAITVQEVVEKALSILLREPIAIVGAGRTDTGVHAKQMFAHFDAQPIKEVTVLIYKLNAFLPKNIAIKSIFKVKKDCHARFDATSRTYLYRIALKKNVFNYPYTYYYKPKLDVERLSDASKILKTYTNFECFSKTHTDVKTFNCVITKAEWKCNVDELQFTITADRFLRNMVRAIVGTLLNIGIGKLKVEDLHDIIKSKNRNEAGFSVPGNALYLTEITYPETLKNYDKS